MFTIDGLLNDVKTTVGTVTEIKRVSWPPPETAYPNDLWAYLEWGPVNIEQASLEVGVHTITITVCKPMRGNLAASTGEYASVVSAALAVHRAFYSNTVIDGEAALSSPVVISKPLLLTYAEARQVACTVTLQCTTGEEVSHLVTD